MTLGSDLERNYDGDFDGEDRDFDGENARPRLTHALNRQGDLGRKYDGYFDDQDRDFDGGDRPERRNSAHRDWAMSLGAGATVGAGQFPAKFTFDVNAPPSCSADYVTFNTGLVGSLTVPSIVAFNNLYSSQAGALPAGTCGTSGPSVEWAYNTNPAGNTTGQTLTSPVLSLDGTKIAFVESSANVDGGSILHILKWKSGQGTITSPVAPDTLLVAGQAWNTTNCPALNSCLVNIGYNGVQADTVSAPYYNYATDELYVGDDNGVLHKFSGVFLGTPAEVVSGGWPVIVDTGAALTSPVLDFTTKNIFVADNTGLVSFIRESGSTIGACGTGVPPCLGSPSQALGGAIVDPPVVDSSTGRVLIFDGTENTTGNNGSVFQFDMALGSQVAVKIGGTSAGASDFVRAGTFDDNYFSTGPGSGHFYTCGKDPNFVNRPAIFQFSFDAAGVLQTTAIPAPLVNLANASASVGEACSPVSEIKNGTIDRIFFSITKNADPTKSATGCAAGRGCVMSIQLGGTWPPAAATSGIAAAGGSSGIVVDNVGTGGQESSVYYTFQQNSTAAIKCNSIIGVGCAVKVTQLSLQ